MALTGREVVALRHNFDVHSSRFQQLNEALYGWFHVDQSSKYLHMTYPAVMDEAATLDLVLSGRSLARFGDGEFTLAENRSIINQRSAPDLCARLRGILRGDGGSCLVGIPNILSETPKAAFWQKYTRCVALLDAQQSYVSSFISRPDSAPWIDTPSYWQRLESLWADRDVTLVRGSAPRPQRKNPKRLTGAVSLIATDLTTARSVTEIIASSVDAWSEYDSLLEQIGRPSLAILCLGATATVLAVDLCARGVHAVDLGHVGHFLRLRKERAA